MLYTPYSVRGVMIHSINFVRVFGFDGQKVKSTNPPGHSKEAYLQGNGVI